MENRTKRARWRTVSQTLIGLSGLLLIAGGCEKLVGVGDTPVTSDDGDAGANSAGRDSSTAGKPSTANGGANSAGAHGNTAGSAGKASGGAASAGEAGSSDNGGSVGTAGGSATAGSGGTSECPCAAPTPSCENNKCVVRGPAMIKVTDSSYYIDSTEVTAAQYRVFQATNPPIAGQRASCAWNTTFTPSNVTPDDDVPIVYVDFCDAAAYCAWADKRLCGAIAGGGLKGTDPSVDTSPDTVNAKKSQWYLACAGPNDSEFCYGNTESDSKCNETYGEGYGPDNMGASPVKYFSECQGHYSGLYDMNGNVVEWIDSCDAENGAADKCADIGGSWVGQMGIGCDDYDLDRRDTQASALGFRCCSK